MTAEKQEHPEPHRLADFAAGLLDDAASNEIEAHLRDDCGKCAEVLESVPEDPLTATLRAGDTVSEAAPGTDSGGGADSAPDWKDWSLPAKLVRPAAAPAKVPADLADHPRYQVLELLGVGGMGAVYKAEHRVMRRPVALKTVSASLLDREDTVERFNREIRAAACLSHPNIVTAHDADQAGSTHFLVMEYVEGTNLGKLVEERGPLPVELACGYIRQAALGLQHAHERGMVHRDIKPHNLMLTPDGTVKILDFGLARFVRESAASGIQTEVGVVMGTPDYMAPEQAMDTRAADIRADIYSLGCTLYFLLAGQAPFAGSSAPAKILKHQQAEPKPIADFRPDVPAGLLDIMKKMTSKCPEDRYQTPAEVAAALAPFAEKKVAAVMVQRPAEPKRRRRSRAGLIALLAGAAAVIVATVIIIRTRDGQTEIKTNDPNATVVVNGKQVYPADKGGKQPDQPGPKVPPAPAAGRWEVQNSGVKDDLRDVTFVNDRLGWVVGHNNTILKTTDGGQTWKRVAERKESGPHWNDVLFISPKEGWIKTSILKNILHTTDGGVTWQEVPLPNTQQAGAHACYHAAVGSTYFLQYSIWVFRTDNAGAKWQQLTDQFPADSQSNGGLSFADLTNGCYVRLSSSNLAHIVMTQDGGKTWKESNFRDEKNVQGNYLRVQFIDKTRGWFIPNFGTIHGTEDGGKTWTPQALGHNRTNSLEDLHFADAQLGHVLCNAKPAEVRRTTDGGKSWKSLGTLKNPEHAIALSFPDSRNGWVVGTQGYIERYSGPQE